jgi:phospholipid transport system substrate-binding protein
MTTRRDVLAGLVGLALGGAALPAAAAPSAEAAGPAATVQRFYDVLLEAMKGGAKLGFEGRRKLVAPAVRDAFDLPLMTRLTVGLQWQNFSDAQRQDVIDAFSEFSIANYASQFDGYSGERFVVEPKAAPAPGNDVIVDTKLVQSDGSPVQLNYLLREVAGKWRIIDVYLSGTVSQLAARRSEFSSVLRSSGVSGLVAVLKKKTAELAKG